MRREILPVRPLVDRLVGDNGLAMLILQTTRNDFRGPPFFELRMHTLLQLFIFHRVPPVGVPATNAGLEVRGEGIVDASGSVSVYLVTDGADRPLQLPCDVPQGTAFLEQSGNDRPLFGGEFAVVGHRNTRVEDLPQVFGFVIELVTYLSHVFWIHFLNQ